MNSARVFWRWAIHARMMVVTILLMALAGVSAGSYAQALVPTQDQLNQLQSLTPAQRQQAIEALGGQQPRTQQQSGSEIETPPDSQVTAAPVPAGERRTGNRFTANDAVALSLELSDPAEPPKLEALNSITGRRVFYLDNDGVLDLPGVGEVALGGLTAQEATLRLASEPLLSVFDIEVYLLPVTPTGTSALEPFGYDVFKQVPSTFAPVDDIPVPAEYVVGPGDKINVQLYGKSDALYSLPVTRDGSLSFPGIGPVMVSGLSFEQTRSKLQELVAAQMIGVEASVSLGKLRSIRIFVLGDVTRPGSYTVSGLSTMTNALFAGGGVEFTGSLRDIQLKRSGRLIRQLDLYDLLLEGDTSDDVKLLPGDVIFVPPVGDVVGVAGEVKRPAIYELKSEDTVAEVLELAGGLKPTALRSAASLERISEFGERVIIDIDFDDAHRVAMSMQDGDILSVARVLAGYGSAVNVSGEVVRSGFREWQPGLRIADVIRSPSDLKSQADPRYVLIRRLSNPDLQVSLVSANLTNAWSATHTAANVELERGDQIYVFGLTSDRAEIIRPWLDQVRLQAETQHFSEEVAVGGRVRAPGNYPLEPGMRVSDLIRAAGGLGEAAYIDQAELSRPVVDADGNKVLLHFPIDLAALRRGEGDNDLLLSPYDFLTIREVPYWLDQGAIEIAGEVRFPGIYRVKRGETLASVLERAGGLTEFAYPAGSVFLREELKKREQEQLKNLTARLRNELLTVPGEDGETQASGEALLEQVQSAQAVGRLVIDLERIINNQGDLAKDLIVKDGDRLLVPQNPQEVTVIGQVQYPTSHLWDDQLTRGDYIARSGGLAFNADQKRIYVVRASGEVTIQRQSAWFRGSTVVDIQPGDTIVVPLDVDRVRPLTLWSSVTQIIYRLAISVAAVNSF
ncbi:MAG: ATPase [Gammaproteobacteria bacterium]|nr:ATPase [Gammaproteobacteria bacterium]